jgi:hypothetical protein
MQYLPITRMQATKVTSVPRYGVTVDGYSHRSGAPTKWMIKVDNRWRRVMVWCFSNASTLFVRIKGKEYIINFL